MAAECLEPGVFRDDIPCRIKDLLIQEQLKIVVDTIQRRFEDQIVQTQFRC
jgi:hypothetical protein